MELLMSPVVWIIGIVVTGFAAWLNGLLNQLLPPPQQALLAIANAFKASSPLPKQRFRLALCWLENDCVFRTTLNTDSDPS